MASSGEPSACAAKAMASVEAITSSAVNPSFDNSVCRPTISCAVNFVLPAISRAFSPNLATSLADAPATAPRFASCFSNFIDSLIEPAVNSVNIV